MYVIFKTVTVHIINQPAYTEAGDNQAVEIGTPVSLDGTGSANENTDEGDTISFLWEIDQAPSGSTAALTDADTATPLFIPDIEGIFIIRLSVNDGYDISTDTVSIVSYDPDSDTGWIDVEIN